MYIEQFKARFTELSINIFRQQVLPCTDKEVLSLEKHLGLSLPLAYKEFLLWGGHKAGGLMEGSDCFFKNLLLIQETAKEILRDDQFSQPFPKDAFVFFSHQDYQFMFFKVLEGENPPVYIYREHQTQTFFQKVYEKYSNFLLDILEKTTDFLLNESWKRD